MSDLAWYGTPPTLNRVLAGKMLEPVEVSGRSLNPQMAAPMFWSRNDMPMAVISGASLGAFRSGR